MDTSPNGTSIPPSFALKDSNGNVWSLVGGGVRINGEWAGIAIADVKQLLIWDGVVYLEQADSTWFWRNPDSHQWCRAAAPGLDVQTILISGQSNAVGIALADGGEVVPLANVTVWDGHSGWPIASEPLPCLTYLQAAYIHGPWLALGQAALNWCRQVRFTGYARGSQTINHWDVGQEGWARLAAAITAAGSVDAFIWFQGESDANAAVTVAAYHDKLVSIIARVRAITSLTLPVVVCGIGPYVGGGTDYAGIRAAQAAVAAELAGVYYLSTLDYPFSEGEHLTADGYRQLGVALSAHLRSLNTP